MTTRFFAGPRCGAEGCKATRYYSDSGLTYCLRGHLAEGIQEYNEEEDQQDGAGNKAQGRKRKNIATRVRVLKATPVLYGKAGYATYLQAYQIILQSQVQFLTQKLQSPSLEGVVRDLWKLFLVTINSQNALPGVSSSQIDYGSAFQDRDNREELNEVSEAIDDNCASSTGSSQVSGNGSGLNMTSKYNTQYPMDRPHLMHTIAFCYLGLILLRVPIGMKNFRGWIVNGEFPFMSSIKCVPQDLAIHLEPQYLEALQPLLRPRIRRMFKWSQETAAFLSRETGMKFPPLNYPPILLDVTKSLYLPLTIFTATNKLIKKYSIDMSLAPNKRAVLNSLPPEARVVTVVVFVTRLLYNLESTDKIRTGSADNVLNWHRQIKEAISTRNGTDLEWETQPESVFSMSTSDVDRYLDWFDATWTIDEATQSLRTETSTTLISIFPKTIPLRHGSELSSEVEWPHTLQDTHGHPTFLNCSLASKCQYKRTLIEAPKSPTAQDDLITLASFTSGLSEFDLRKALANLEHHFEKVDNNLQAACD